MITGKLFAQKKMLIAAVLYFSICAVLISNYGIQLSGEAEKFIENANLMLQGREFFNGLFGYFYLVYILLVAAFIKLSVNLIVVAALQVLLSFTAAVCLYKLLSRTMANSPVPFLFFVIYLLCFPIQKWNFFLYSESIHTSLLVIGIYLFDRTFAVKQVKGILPLLLFLLLIVFSRPVGVIFVLAAFIAFLYWLHLHKYVRKLVLFSAVGLIACIVLLSSPYATFVNPDSIRRMEVICQVPESNLSAPYVEYNRSGLYTAFTVIRDEVGFTTFFKTGFKKLASFFGMYRSFYSWKTNLVLLSFTLLYPFMLVGLLFKGKGRSQPVRLFATAYILLTAFGIFFTCDEWSNRFIAPVFPFILILAAYGLHALFEYRRQLSQR